ncbi:hypothetical protein [Vallitalea longa]|nr:hypothetical protein [Vallitalea longa]
MKKIAVATAIEELDEILDKKCKTKYESEIVLYRRYLIENQFDIAILSGRLNGEESLDKTIFDIISNGTRVIFITTSDNDDEIKLCIRYGIRDILFDDIGPTDILKLIENPKSLKEMKSVFEKYQSNEKEDNQNKLRVNIISEVKEEKKDDIKSDNNIRTKIDQLTKKNSLLDDKNSKKNNKLNYEDNNKLTKMELYKEEKKDEIKKDVDRPVVTIIKDKIIGTLVIAVTGAMNRVGTTHTCISIASFLKSLKQEVALVEMHESDNFSIIKNAYEDIEEKDRGFILNGIHFYSYKNEGLIEILNTGFNYIVLDMGEFEHCNKVEFKRANTRVVVSGVKDWEIPYLDLYLKEKDLVKKTKYYFTFSDKELFKFVKYNMNGLECYMAPFIADPFIVNESEVFSKMFEEVIPTNTIKKKKLFKLRRG